MPFQDSSTSGGGGGGTIGGSGTANTIARFTPDGVTLGNASLTDNGTTVQLIANDTLSAAAGTGVLDFSSASGATKTTTGPNQLSGDVTLASGKNFTAAGGTTAVNLSAASGAYSSTTGTQTLNGATTVASGNAFTVANGLVSLTEDDATTNAVTDVATIVHTTSGTAVANIGTGVLLRTENGAGSTVDAARIAGILSTVTAGSEASGIDFYTRAGGAALSKRISINNNGSVLFNQASFIQGPSTGGSVTFNATTVTIGIGGATPHTFDNGKYQTTNAVQVQAQGGFLAGKRTTVADANNTTTINDHIIAYTSISAARVVTLTTTGTAGTPFLLWIMDESGSASAGNTITGTPSSGNINGAASKVLINSAFGSALVYCNGTNWFQLK
jgi:hypothetical protein